MEKTAVGSRQDRIATWQKSIRYQLKYTLGLDIEEAMPNDIFNALALVARHHQLDGYFTTRERHFQERKKRVYYLSMEFLIGQSLRNNLLNMGMLEDAREALAALGVDFDEIVDSEVDAALGNGGLGRLAACFIDSMATLDIAGSGHGIKYEYGLFRQQIQEGRQVEKPDDWHSANSPWLVEYPNQAMMIPIYGHIEEMLDPQGNYNPMWMGWKIIMGIPHDYLVSGFDHRAVNRLRLYSASASDSFDIQIFNHGDYLNAVNQKIASENISKILYPADEVLVGKELRLTQEYFLVACTLCDIMRDFFALSSNIAELPERVAIQLNDTHPALAIAELMRKLVDEQHVDWDLAWDITQRTCSYTNHTLMPEALETWSVTLFERLLPRHLQIIYEINARFLRQVAERWPEEPHLLHAMSLIEEGHEKKVRMAYLAIIGSHKVNGVAKLHSELIKTHLVPDFYRMMPEKFVNQTNGVTPRRWIQQANPSLSSFLTRRLGRGWVTDLSRLSQLGSLAQDRTVVEEIAAIKRHNKVRLSQIIAAQQGILVDPDALFDSQVKRIHEYKRQLLNILHVIHQYLDIIERDETVTPKVHIFSGKAAPGYAMAKLIVQLINQVAQTINRDARVGDRLKVIFLEDYKISLAEHIIPATDLSEQISTAGTEASGTSNMKFAMNGALTIGTLDGANIEIRDAVGADNFYLFGLTAQEVSEHHASAISPYDYYHANPLLKRVIDSLTSTLFSADKTLFAPIVDTLLTWGDRYLHLADFESYRLAQSAASRDFSAGHRWHQRTLLTIASMEGFSSDRTILGYGREIWRAID